MTNKLVSVTLPESSWFRIRAGLLRIKGGLSATEQLSETERDEYLAGFLGEETSLEIIEQIDSQLSAQGVKKSYAVRARRPR